MSNLEKTKDQSPLFIDSISLAKSAFIHCRAYTSYSENLLTLLVCVLPESLKQGMLTIRADESMTRLCQDLEIKIPRGMARLKPVLSPRMRLAQQFCTVSAEELLRLKVIGCRAAVRSLANALHNFPQAIENESLDQIDRYAIYVLSEAAPYWGTFTPRFRRSFEKPTGLEGNQILQMVNKKGFASKLYSDEARNDD